MKNTNLISLAYIVLFVLGLTSNAMAQEYSVQSGDWNDASTWNEGVPETTTFWGRLTAAEDVVIKAGTVVVLTEDIAFGWPRTLTIEEGATLTGDYDVSISAGGTFLNNGTLDAQDITVGAIGTFENNGVTIVENATFNRGFFISSIVQNEGEITVEETLTNNSTDVSGDGNYYVESTSGSQPLPEDSEVDNRWTGESGSDWENQSNWYSGELPSSTDIVSIGLNITNFPEINSNLTIAGITITEAGKLTVNANGRLTANSLENNGELIIESSSSSQTGSLFVENKSGNGTVKVQRYIPDELDGDDWHSISSPISGIDLATFAANSEVYYSSTWGDYDLAPYNTADGIWGPYVKPGSGNFALGRGYSMRRVENPGNPAITFSGSMDNLNVDDLGISITYGLNGWNAMGNPFISAINIESFLNVNGGAIYEAPYNVAYLWDPTIGDFAGVATGNVALGQGFLVKSKTGGGTINFTTSMQVQNAPVFKSAEISSSIHLYAAAENCRNRTTLRFHSGMTDGLDNKYDIGKHKGNPDIALYTRMPNNSAYDLQDQALPGIIFEAVKIPVGLDFVPGGEITFSIDTESFPEDLEVFLEDTETEIYTKLNIESASYTTNVVAESHGTGRFNLLIRKQATTGIDLDSEKKFAVHTRDKLIFINGPANADTGFELFNIEGKCWYKGKAQNQSLNQIDGSSFPAGVYLLKISESGAIQSTKLILTGD